MSTTRRPLLWHLFPSFFLISLVALVVVTLTTRHTVRSFYQARALEGIRERALLVETPVMTLLTSGREQELAALVTTIGRQAATRITVIAPDGRVLADSQEPPEKMDNHRDRPEVREALAHGSGTARRWSNTLQRQFIYAATPLSANGQLLGVLRTAMPVADYEQALHDLVIHLLLTAVLVILTVAGATLIISRSMAATLKVMEAGAVRFAAGDLNTKLYVHHSREMDGLAAALNDMAGQLHERFETIARQHAQTEGIMASMTEGLLAVDAQQRIVMINAAARRILHLAPAAVEARTLLEVTLNSSLHDLASRALASDTAVEGDAEVTGPTPEGGVWLRVHAAALKTTVGRRTGAVLVLTDVTRLRQLENLRRDFVANVSHELRTPVTAIRGFVETLEDGAIDDPDKARPFLGIISRQVDRLGAIIEDLLMLSRMDGDQSLTHLTMESFNLKGVLDAAVQACAGKAADRGIRIEVDAPTGAMISAHPLLLQQAVVNLLDNAVNYSPANARVRLHAERAAGEVRVSIQDWGCGIAPEHHERIFERFYRVDKGRSREVGGTGLGLAIVKHIMQAHGGRITLLSAPGQGSTFTLHLPAGPAPLSPS